VNVSETGLVTVKDSSILDYESITEIKIRVLVIDTLYQKTSDTTVTIPVINVNENPILDDQNFDVDEHKVPGTVVGTLEWGENDSIPVFRQDVFTAVGGDTAYFSITPEGVIKTKKEFDYETEPHTYTIDVMLADKNDPTLFVVKTVTITINDVNENPKIITDTIQVKENSDPGTIVDTLEAIDKDNDELTWILEEDPSGCFELSESGVVTTKKCSNLDYEKNKTISIKVKVTDNRGGVDSKIVVVKLIDVPAPDLEITEASNEDSLWKNPEIIYTHTDSLNICWEINKANKDCSDTTLKPGENKICKEVCDVDGFEGCSKDCFIAYDYRDSLLWIFNNNRSSNSEYCYVYSIKTGTFGKFKFSQPVTDVVNDYPDYLLQNGSGGNLLSLTGRTNINLDDSDDYSGLMITRPMKLENGLALKSIMQIKNIRYMEGSMTLRIFASNDLNHWVELHSLRGTPWKYYRFRYDLSDMKATDRFGGSVLITQERRTDKLR
jgi:hypothetical protein